MIARSLLALLVSTAVPAQDGWMDLFDGKSLDGWTVRNGTATYEIQDGAIIGTTVKGSPNTFLCTDRFFGDFELTFEVKLFDDRLNSGVQIRSHSNPTYKNGRLHGPQVEVSTNGEAGFIYDEGRRGWLSKDRTDPVKRAAFKRGEWNAYRVACLGGTMQTWINGVPIATVYDTVDGTGMIGLQVHSVGGDPKWQVGWRNLKIREIGDGGGWVELFDGKSLAGWRVNENEGSAKVENGAIVVGGRRAHVFYAGMTGSHSFQNFDFEAVVMTKPKANSGIYFHTLFQESGWPSKGYEVQVNNTQGDWRRTAGLYGIDDIKEAPAKDNEWFNMAVSVRGQRVTVSVDGKQVVDYTEPEGVERPRNFAGRLLDRGTFALQCHDPGSIVHYKRLRVRMHPDTK